MHDFLDHAGAYAVVMVCMRCGLMVGEPGWERCFTPYVTHDLALAKLHSIVRNDKTGRIMLISRVK